MNFKKETADTPLGRRQRIQQNFHGEWTEITQINCLVVVFIFAYI